MKKEYTLNFDSITDLTNFVKRISNKIPYDVDAMYNRQIIDAKSLLGLINLATHPVKVRINTDDEFYINKFAEICKDYLVHE